MNAALPVQTRRGSALAIGAAVLLSLWVIIANRAPLFYYDTSAYMGRGQTLLAVAGIDARIAPPEDGARQPSRTAQAREAAGTDAGIPPDGAPVAGADPAPSESGSAAPAADGSARPGGPAPASPETEQPRNNDAGVDGSRSPVYSLVIALFAVAGGLEALILANALFTVSALWLAARVIVRSHRLALSPAVLALAAVAAGALGSLSFYVSFLMPDIFAPILILMAALLGGYAGRMAGWEVLLATLFGVVAVSVHLSHQAIAMLLIPLVLVISLAFGRRRWLLAPGLVALMALIGMAEQAAFRTAVQTVKKSEVVFLPFITARLIQDGVGYDYLAERCPDAEFATCKLWDALQQSDDPWRLTATHIAFETSPRLGSYRRMPAEDQRAVSRAQLDFFLAVLADRPAATTLAFLRNTLTQARMNSVDMTLPKETTVAQFEGHEGLSFLSFSRGPLVEDQGWLVPVTAAQQALYAAGALVIFVAALWPGMPRPARGFLLLVLLGILVNAFVCGGVSQPATRYGARVAWLLPAIAVFAWPLLRRKPSVRGTSSSKFALQP